MHDTNTLSEIKTLEEARLYITTEEIRKIAAIVNKSEATVRHTIAAKTKNYPCISLLLQVANEKKKQAAAMAKEIVAN